MSTPPPSFPPNPIYGQTHVDPFDGRTYTWLGTRFGWMTSYQDPSQFFLLNNVQTSSVLFGTQNPSTGQFIASGTSVQSPVAENLVIRTQNTERLRVLASGALSFGSSGAAAGSAGNVLVSNGFAAPPAWQSFDGLLSSINPTITGTWTFSNLNVTSDPVDANNVVRKSFLDSQLLIQNNSLTSYTNLKFSDANDYTDARLNTGALTAKQYTDNAVAGATSTSSAYTDARLDTGALTAKAYVESRLDTGTLTAKAYTNAVVSATFGDLSFGKVAAATTADLGGTYTNGPTIGEPGIGATLAGTVPLPAASFDNVALVVGDKVLVKDQAARSQNGIYVVKQLSPWLLERDTSADVKSEVLGSIVGVFSGSSSTNSNKGSVWVLYTDLTNPQNFTVGVDPLLVNRVDKQVSQVGTIDESAIIDGSILARVAGNETITGAWSFTGSAPISTVLPTIGQHLTTKAYVDNEIITQSTIAIQNAVAAVRTGFIIVPSAGTVTAEQGNLYLFTANATVTVPASADNSSAFGIAVDAAAPITITINFTSNRGPASSPSTISFTAASGSRTFRYAFALSRWIEVT